MKLRKAVALFTTVAAVTLAPAVVSAQSNDTPALPKVIRIFREEVKQGKDAAHEKTETSFARMLAKNKYPAHSIALTLLAGPSEAWFLEAHDSFKSIEDVQSFTDKNAAVKADFANLDALDGELRANSRSMIAVLKDDLCYRPEEFMKELPHSRYMMVETMRVRPFADRRFAELAHQVIAADKTAGIEESVATYQVVAGAPSGTYLLFFPMKSMQFMDEGPARSKAMMEALGMEKAEAFYKNAAETIATSESFIMAINPRMSYVSKEFASQDPDFWTPKPAPMAKPAAKPATEKTGAGQ